MRVEGDRHDQEATLVGDLSRSTEDVAVAAVHAVEVADHDSRASQVGRDLVEGMPDLHGRKTIDGPQTNTATARASPSRGSYNARNSPPGSNSAVRPGRLMSR